MNKGIAVVLLVLLVPAGAKLHIRGLRSNKGVMPLSRKDHHLSSCKKSKKGSEKGSQTSRTSTVNNKPCDASSGNLGSSPPPTNDTLAGGTVQEFDFTMNLPSSTNIQSIDACNVLMSYVTEGQSFNGVTCSTFSPSGNNSIPSSLMITVQSGLLDSAATANWFNAGLSGRNTMGVNDATRDQPDVLGFAFLIHIELSTSNGEVSMLALSLGMQDAVGVGNEHVWWIASNLCTLQDDTLRCVEIQRRVLFERNMNGPPATVSVEIQNIV